MLAKEILNKYVKEDMRDEVGVIVISQKEADKEMFWYSVHENEEIPAEDYDVAIHIKQAHDFTPDVNI